MCKYHNNDLCHSYPSPFPLPLFTGPTITFSFSECPLCKQWIDHSSVGKEVRAITKLRKHLEELGTKGRGGRGAKRGERKNGGNMSRINSV